MTRKGNPPEFDSPWAADPFVAPPVSNDKDSGARPPRTIDEILQTLNGYQSSSDSTTAMAATGKSSRVSKPTVSNMKINPVNRSSAQSTNPMATDNNIEWDAAVEEHQLPEFDVRNFSSIVDVDSSSPEPIRGAFECEQDYYDYAAIDTRIEQTTQWQAGEPAMVGCCDATGLPATEVFWANANDVIFINGKDGFGYIDLACFDVSAASFEANQIRIRMPDGTQFQIDYRNVTHAVFAGGVEIELAANDVGFSPER